MPAKKTTKPTAKKKTPAKKPVAKKPVARTSAARSNQRHSFLQTQFTEQTIYWIIIGVAVIALAAWVLAIQVQLNDMYDQIDANAASGYITPKAQ